jgi:hypothetical protein
VREHDRVGYGDTLTSDERARDRLRPGPAGGSTGRSDTGHVESVEEVEQRAVFAARAVERREDDVRAFVGEERQQPGIRIAQCHPVSGSEQRIGDATTGTKRHVAFV